MEANEIRSRLYAAAVGVQGVIEEHLADVALSDLAGLIAPIAMTFLQEQPERDDPDIETLAIAALFEIGKPNVKAVSERVGVSRKRLYALPKFLEMVRELRGDHGRAGDPRRGVRNSGGGVDGIVDDDS